MMHVGPRELVTLLVVGILLFGHKVGGKTPLQIAQGLADAISNFRGGGPGSPSHPLPANDSWLLGRKRFDQDDNSDQLR